MTTINLTPTRSEHARVTAYILASHASGSPYDFGDYWNFTEAQEDSLFATWNRLEDLSVGSFTWLDLPKSHKAKLITQIYKATLAELSK